MRVIVDLNFLYNNETWKTASRATSTFLLDIVSTGETERKRSPNNVLETQVRSSKTGNILK